MSSEEFTAIIHIFTYKYYPWECFKPGVIIPWFNWIVKDSENHCKLNEVVQKFNEKFFS